MPTNTAIPRWKKILERALEQHPRSTTLQLATITDTAVPIPRVRSHIFRQFLSNPKAPYLPLLITTTDVRMPKVQEILDNPNVEVAWWIEGTQEQLRLAGRVSMVTALNSLLYKATREQLLNNANLDYEGGLASLKPAGYDWEGKRVEVFKKMSARMKATWCRPTPGSVLEGGEAEAKKWPEKVEEPQEGSGGYEGEKKNWEVALDNFVLVVIEPSEVDYLNLGVVPNRRFKFARDVEGGWNEVELVP